MTEVRRHKRRTASGKMTTVRHHTRDTGSSADPPGTWYFRNNDDGEIYAVHPDGSAHKVEDVVEVSPAPHVSTLRPPEPAQPDGFWDDSEEQPAGDWWAADEVEHEGRTVKVNRVPAYKPQGDYDFARDEPDG